MYAIAALVAALACGGSFWYGTKVGEDSCIAAQKKQADLIEEVADKAMKGAAAAIASNKPRNVTIKQELQREIRTKTEYVDCRNSPAGLRSLNEALTGQRTEPPGNSKLPDAVPAQ